MGLQVLVYVATISRRGWLLGKKCEENLALTLQGKERKKKDQQLLLTLLYVVVTKHTGGLALSELHFLISQTKECIPGSKMLHVLF